MATLYKDSYNNNNNNKKKPKNNFKVDIMFLNGHFPQIYF